MLEVYSFPRQPWTNIYHIIWESMNVWTVPQTSAVILAARQRGKGRRLMTRPTAAPLKDSNGERRAIKISLISCAHSGSGILLPI